MSIAPNELLSRLVQSELCSPADAKRYSDAFAESGQSVAGDSRSLAERLVRDGVISGYQATRLLEPECPELRVGSFLVAGDQPVTPFSHWLPAQKPVTHAAPVTKRGFLLRVPLAGLDDTRRGWLAIHSEIHAQTLLPIELSGGAQAATAEQTVEIFAPLPEGAALCKVLESQSKLSPRKTVRLGVDLADALAALHAKAVSATPLAHGAVGADHVWVTPKGHAILLRDPSAPPRSPLADLTTSWIDRVEPAARYAAPELSSPLAMPTPASDIYSLGCLLYATLIGRPAFVANDDRALFALHQQALPPEIIEAVQRGPEGHPILRVLAYAMAKDPAARFASAAAMGEALKRAGELLETDSQPPKTTGPRRGSDPQTKASVTPPPVDPPTKPMTKPTGVDAAAAPPVPVPPVSVPSATSPPVVRTAPPQAPTAPQPTAVQSPQPTAVQSPQPTAAQTPQPETPITDGNNDRTPAATSPAPASSAPASPAPRRRRPRRKNRIPLLAGMMVLPLLMLGLAIALRGRGPVSQNDRPRPQPGIIHNVPVVPDSRRAAADDESRSVNGYEIIESDRLLWVPPFAADSSSPSLELLPPGPAAILSIPVADVFAKQPLQPLLSTFSPEFETLIALVEQRSAVKRHQIKRCTAALFPGRDGWPDVALVIELTEPQELAALIESWGVAESRTSDGAVLFAGESLAADAYYIAGGDNGKAPEDGRVQRFAIGSLERIGEVAQNAGGSIPLPRNLQTLWNQTSQESDLVVLVTPNFLFADGREMVQSTVPQFGAALKQWLMPDVAAFSLSLAATDEMLYAELRELPSGGANSVSLLQSLRDKFTTWPDWADQFILNSDPDPSWRLLATRLPLMLRFVNDQIRSTIIGETVVASAYLPIDASAQVGLGTFLAMNTSAGEVTKTATPVTEALTVEQMLERPMSISFLQLSLQFAVESVVDEFKQSLPSGSTMPAVRIVGADLEKNGITQNQQIRGFERNDQPLRSVLTDLVLGANPDRTATGPDDPKQSLIWVVYPIDKSPAETEILITTRDAAAERYELPREFQINDQSQ